MVTKEGLRAMFSMMISLAEQAKKIGDSIVDELGKNDATFDLIDSIINGECTDVESAIQVLEEAGRFEDINMEEGEKFGLPYVSAINAFNVEVGVKYPSGERLAAFLGESDFGTFQSGAVYYTENGSPVDLTMAEIKKGDLAEIAKRPKNNKDIDVYIWGDAYSEDYTSTYIIKREDILTALAEEEKLTLNSFFVNPEWRTFVSSMLFESDESIIASAQWTYKGETRDVCLKVSGPVTVRYKDSWYTNPILFPTELRDKIKRDPDGWDVYSPSGEGNDTPEGDVYVVDRNWFEYRCGEEMEEFEGNISKSEPEDFFEGMLTMAKNVFGVTDPYEVIYPDYSLEGYDKDNDVYVTFGYSNNIEDLKEAACKYVPSLIADKLIRKCDDGHYEPLDDIMVMDFAEDANLWSYCESSLTFRLEIGIRFNKPVRKEDSISIGSFDFDFAEKSINFDFEEYSGNISEEDATVVYFEGKNPDYTVFPRTGLLTDDLLRNVTSINDIYTDIDGVDDCDEAADYLLPVEVVEAAFVVIADNGEFIEIPIPSLTGWKFRK